MTVSMSDKKPSRATSVSKVIQTLMEILTDEDLKCVAEVYRGALRANQRHWVDEGRDPKTGRARGHWEIIPDFKTRIAAANMIAAYKEGLPVQRQVVLAKAFQSAEETIKIRQCPELIEAIKGLTAALNALVETPPEHPALTSQKKHIPFLVISGELSIPAADRIRVHNLAWRKRKHPALRVIVGPQLLKRFIALAQDFWPQMPEDSRALLSLYLADGRGSLDRSAFAKLIDSVVGSKDGANRATVVRRISAANVFASYALSGFYNAENYWELVQGWTIAAAAIARVAEETGISEKYWASSFGLAVDEATSTLHSLSEEALTDSALWPKTNELDELTRSRCTLCAAAIAARLLISRLSGVRWDGETKAATTLI